MDSGRNVGSLLRLFKSGFFDTWLCISYLYKHFQQPGIVDYLCNELYRLAVEKPEDIDMYATQLCVLVVHQAANSREQTSLERFLLDQCSKSIRFAIKACWIFQGFVQDRMDGDHNDPIFTAAVRLREFCEIACVNCKRPSFPNSRLLKSRSNSLPSLFKDLKVEASSDISRSAGNSPVTFVPASDTILPTNGTQSAETCNANGSNSNSNGTNGTSNAPSRPIATSPLAMYSSNSSTDLCELEKTEEENYDGEFWQMELTKKDRCDYFNAILAFVEQLGQISQRLVRVPVEQRQASLEDEIRSLNKRMPDGLYLPLWHDSRYAYHSIIRVPPEDARVLNSRERVPFLINLELLQSTEDVTSKAIHKIVSSFVDVVQAVKSTITDNKNHLSHSAPNTSPLSPTTPHTTSPTPTPATSPPPIHATSPPIHAISPTPIHAMSPTPIPAPTPAEPRPAPTARPHSVSAPPMPILSPTPTSPLSPLPVPPSQPVSQVQRAYRHPQLSPTPPPPTISTQWYPASAPSSIITSVPCPPVSSSSSASSPFGVMWEQRVARVCSTSPFGHLPNWSMSSVIMKYGDDLRQEQLASQLLMTFKRVWDDAKLPLWLSTYEILVTSANSGIIETISDAISIHNIKKTTPNFSSLLYFFVDLFGEVSTENFKSAQRNFVESLAAYSIVCYILQIKDRHNGNILLDSQGHIIHIDFGFMLSNSPGNMYFESAPFKLTQEFVDVMGGSESRLFQYFKALCIRGFLEIRKHMDRVVTLVEMMMTYGPALPSFVMGPTCISDLTLRFNMGLTEKECVAFVEGLIAESLDHFKTRAYDKYQSFVNGIIP